ncbi:hypothetical protein ACIRG5_47095 [Lentzea sp. NPDC102401]|uniref:hypothetical protein n=1 Tax=Lentzea sp. NPDC102401 TaxID=3364128 RepID=UPI0037FBD57A
MQVEIETNGTLPSNLDTLRGTGLFRVPPKVSNSGIDAPHRLRRRPLEAFIQSGGKACFKFVCATTDDVARSTPVVDEFGHPTAHGVDDARRHGRLRVTRHMQAIADDAINRGFNVTTRLHVLAWGNKRGR